MDKKLNLHINGWRQPSAVRQATMKPSPICSSGKGKLSGKVVAFMALLLIIGGLVTGCRTNANTQTVVIYTSVDQVYAEPVFKKFEAQTGIKVLPVFDVEAAKTTGLVNRLLAEKNRPQADVFWNSEFVQTLLLKEQGILTPYQSFIRKGIPSHYMDPEGYWSGFGGRIRVLLVNTNLVQPEDYPTSVFDLVTSKTPGQAALAQPLFGTTATHAAAMYALVGPEEGKAFFEKIKERKVQVVDGNSVVRDLVVTGQLKFGLTDSDDAEGAVKKGAPVAIIIPDQESMGTLFIPNTVGLIANSPHSRNGKKFIDFLLSEEVEKDLLASGAIQFSVRDDGKIATFLPGDSPPVKRMEVDFIRIYRQLALVKEDLTKIFIK